MTVGSGSDATTRIGRFDQVGCIIDPNQHTALVMGWVDNPDGKLRVGQFVTTRLEIPPPPGEVVVPASALCEESDRTCVFVQSDGKSTYVRRSVAVTRRHGDKVCIRSQPTPEEKRRGLEPLAAGEQVVVSRVVQLAACLDSLQQNAGAPCRRSEVAMINRLIRWALHNRLVVILLAAGLLGYGIYAFREVNVEAYPDPAPAIVEVVARYPGASAEEVERQVTIPLEVALAGMPGLAITRTQSLFELCHVSNQFEYGVDPAAARQEVLNRLRLADLPAGVTPDISPRSPTGEIFRYVLVGPKDSAGRDIYDPNDLKSLQDMHAGEAVSPPAAGGRRDQLRRDRETLRDPSRPGADAALRHHPAAAQGRDRLEQFQRRGRLHRPGRRRPRGPLPGDVGHGARPHGNRDGHERPRRRTQLPPGRGRTPHPRDPPDRAQRHQQRPGARQRRGRRGTAAGRFAAGQSRAW